MFLAHAPRRHDSNRFKDLAGRFETPDSRNRWDSPLFTVTPGEIAPAGHLLLLLIHGVGQHIVCARGVCS
jgi:hypothetical protein